MARHGRDDPEEPPVVTVINVNKAFDSFKPLSPLFGPAKGRSAPKRRITEVDEEEFSAQDIANKRRQWSILNQAIIEIDWSQIWI